MFNCLILLKNNPKLINTKQGRKHTYIYRGVSVKENWKASVILTYWIVGSNPTTDIDNKNILKYLK